MNHCAICNKKNSFLFCETVLKKYQVKYYRCDRCAFIQTEEPYWLEESYSDAISRTDTGLVMRNISLALRLAPILYFNFNYKKAFIDLAGGYGMLTRLMRDFGYNYFWEDAFCSNELAKGFEADDAPEVVACSAFEVMEHLNDPKKFIEDAFSKYACEAFVFSTETYESETAPSRDWWYYSFDSGQHISFYHKKTLQVLASSLNLYYIKIGKLHVFSKSPIEMSLFHKLLSERLFVITALFSMYKLGSKTIKDSEYLAGLK